MKVLVLTASVEGDLPGRAEVAGADGALHKTATPVEVAVEVTRLSEGAPSAPR